MHRAHRFSAALLGSTTKPSWSTNCANGRASRLRLGVLLRATSFCGPLDPLIAPLALLTAPALDRLSVASLWYTDCALLADCASRSPRCLALSVHGLRPIGPPLLRLLSFAFALTAPEHFSVCCTSVTRRAAWRPAASLGGLLHLSVGCRASR
jgi:hypothetical protein